MKIIGKLSPLEQHYYSKILREKSYIFWYSSYPYGDENSDEEIEAYITLFKLVGKRLIIYTNNQFSNNVIFKIKE